MQRKKILSICIPTFNRAEYLKSCLLSIFYQINGVDSIEVVVSDNHSNDDTISILESFSHVPNFRYFSNSENLGMSKNIISLISRAEGEFCWLIGDDDFILNGALEALINKIKENPSIDFFYVKPIGLTIDEYKSFDTTFSTAIPGHEVKLPLKNEILDDWQELIRPKYSLIFMGELMTSVFRKSIWEQYTPNTGGEFLTSVESSYVFTLVYANTFIGKKTMFIETPMIIAFSGAREWWDRLGYVLIVLVKGLLDLYKEKGIKKSIMKECYIQYISITLPFIWKYAFSNSSTKDKIPFKIYFKFLASYPLLTIRGVLRILKNTFRSSVSKIIMYINPSLHKKIKASVN
ncbi:glycosyltransferase family 2 protein [Pedobacter agri]|uniref:glycosyltransferase family 2 protein n=1 Tax=Pedobacter agri TaxID=454586 RepID=UPI00292F37CA|nr:glycosyltransferase family 2 protein [Pedobacter agri]